MDELEINLINVSMYQQLKVIKQNTRRTVPFYDTQQFFLFLLQVKLNQNGLNDFSLVFLKLFTFNTDHSDQCLTPRWKRVFKQYSIQCPFTSSLIYKGQSIYICDIPLAGFFGGTGVNCVLNQFDDCSGHFVYEESDGSSLLIDSGCSR